MSKEDSNGPLGGIFTALGALVGTAYGATIADAPGGFLGIFIGAWLGNIIEHIVFRLLMVALFVIMILARQAFFEAIFDGAHTADPVIPTESIAEVRHLSPTGGLGSADGGRRS